MIVTWLCLLFMLFNVCEVYGADEGITRAPKVKTVVSIKKSFAFNTKRFIAFMKKCPSYLRRFLIWLKKYVKHGIRCVPEGLEYMKCFTMDGLNKIISNKAWKRIPKFFRKRLTKPTKLYYRG